MSYWCPTVQNPFNYPIPSIFVCPIFDEIFNKRVLRLYLNENLLCFAQKSKKIKGVNLKFAHCALQDL